jgi:sRNA-binding protein
VLVYVQAHAAAADEESRRKRTAERSRRLAEVQKQQAALEQAQASALQVGQCVMVMLDCQTVSWS